MAEADEARALVLERVLAGPFAEKFGEIALIRKAAVERDFGQASSGAGEKLAGTADAVARKQFAKGAAGFFADEVRKVAGREPAVAGHVVARNVFGQVALDVADDAGKIGPGAGGVGASGFRP